MVQTLMANFCLFLPYSFLSSPVPWKLALRLKKSTGKSICVIDLPFFGFTSCSWGISGGKFLAACLSRLLSLIDSRLFPQLTTLDDTINNYQRTMLLELDDGKQPLRHVARNLRAYSPSQGTPLLAVSSFITALSTL